ncbi:Crp/Fnr family transcriptional regulator [Salipaludibacillus daqingensis]|uniref:Crp/Fnr family transcriptional regulator n=1 Tax=Salipaludibacillus daqingensis TaxID=3041001 RepID=UPI0024748AB5|nr:Crp/Fnr family transcriptional regulator [Salipaludibacillus daqingensis]
MINEHTLEKAQKLFPFFNEMTGEEEKLTQNHMTFSQMEKDQILMGEGFHCLHIFFILKGVIRVYKLSEEGREITLYRMGEGETCLMTASCIMTDMEFNAMAQVEKDIEVVAVPAKIFKKLLSQNGAFQKFIFAKTFERMHDIMSVVETITFDNMDKRVASFLYSLTEEKPNFVYKLTHENIAYEIGTAREVVSRTLKKFAAKNIVQISRGSIKVIDRNSLEELL